MTGQQIVQIPPAEHRAPLVSGGRPQAIVPNSIEGVYRIAEGVCKAGMAPRGLETPEKAMIAIMHGLEVGMTPMAALQRIAVVNGRPTIWGDGAIGLVRASGLCEFIHESISGAGDEMVALCEAKRKGEEKPIVGTFSVADAKKAGLWGKQGPWQQFPKRMLQMRARAFCLRDGFADVLGGLYLREEIEDEAIKQESRAPKPPAIEHKPTVPMEIITDVVATEIPAKPVEDSAVLVAFPADATREVVPVESLNDGAAVGQTSQAAPSKSRAPRPGKNTVTTGPFDFDAHKALCAKALSAADDVDAVDDCVARFLLNWGKTLTAPQQGEIKLMCLAREEELTADPPATTTWDKDSE